MQTGLSGGQPLLIKDFELIQGAYLMGFRALSQALTTDDCVLTGCVVSASGLTYTVTAGTVMLGGEIYQFDGGSITVTAGNKPLIQGTSFPIEMRTFSNGSVQYCWRERKGQLTQGTGGGGFIDLLAGKTLASKLGLSATKTLADSWIAFTPDIISGATLNLGHACRYKQIGKTIFVNWNFSFTTDAPGSSQYTVEIAPPLGNPAWSSTAILRQSVALTVAAGVYEGVCVMVADSGAPIVLSRENGSGWAGSTTHTVTGTLIYEI